MSKIKQFKKNRILLMGGAGFIGRNILETLGQKYEFLAPSKQELDLRKEIAVLKYLERNKVNLIIHAVSIGGPGQEKQKNYKGILADNLRTFFSLIRAKRFYKKMIFFDSGAAYDKKRDLKKVKETELGRAIPTDEYGFYKYICSEYLEKVKDIISLRLFGLYGKYEDYRFKFVSNAIVKNLLKQDIIINQNAIFDYLFIEDLIPIVDYFILNRPKFKSYNVVPNKSIDLVTVADIINEISDYKSKIVVLNKGLNNEYTGDNSRLKNEIPNLKFTDYKQGIEKLFRYYQENFDKIDKDFIIRDNYLKSILKKSNL